MPHLWQESLFQQLHVQRIKHASKEGQRNPQERNPPNQGISQFDEQGGLGRQHQLWGADVLPSDSRDRGLIPTYAEPERRAHQSHVGPSGKPVHHGLSFNRHLLKNIRKSDRALAIFSTGGRTTTNLQGDLPGYGTVWFHPGGITNILLL